MNSYDLNRILGYEFASFYRYIYNLKIFLFLKYILTMETKLRQIIDSGKPASITHQGKKTYISKKKIEEIKAKEKEGGVLPLLALLPLNIWRTWSSRCSSWRCCNSS